MYHPEPDIFFPGQGQAKLRNEAKAVCLQCPVRKECHDAADRQGEMYGIWAAETKKQYRKS